MNRSRWFFIAASMLLVGSVHSQTVHVDPLNGVDDTTGGGTTNPYRTITFALGQQTGSSLLVKLHKGKYSPTSGEVFPIQVSGSVTIEGTLPNWTSQDTCGAVIDLPQTPLGSTAFEILGGDVTLRRMKITSLHRGIWVRGMNSVVLEDLEVTGVRAIDFDGTVTQPATTARIEHCRLRSMPTAPPLNSAGLRLHWSSPVNNRTNFEVFRCDISGGNQSTRAVDLDGQAGGFAITFVSSVMHASQAGVFSTGNIALGIYHCTLWGNGTGNANEGGLVFNGTGTFGAFGQNNLFTANGGALDFNPPNAFTGMTNNLVDQLGPGGMGVNGNQTGPSYLANPAFGDFHLLKEPVGWPTSKAINFGITSGGSYDRDLDGVQRISGTIADAGADEHETHWVYVNPPFQIGQSSTVSLLGNGAALEWYSLFVGTGPTTPVAFPGAFLLQNPVKVAGAQIPTTNRATFNTAIPFNPALVGFPLVLQSLYLDQTSSTLSFSNIAPELVHP